MKLQVTAVPTPTHSSTGVSPSKALTVVLLTATLLAAATSVLAGDPRVLRERWVHHIQNVTVTQNFQRIYLSEREYTLSSCLRPNFYFSRFHVKALHVDTALMADCLKAYIRSTHEEKVVSLGCLITNQIDWLGCMWHSGSDDLLDCSFGGPCCPMRVFLLADGSTRPFVHSHNGQLIIINWWLRRVNCRTPPISTVVGALPNVLFVNWFSRWLHGKGYSSHFMQNAAEVLFVFSSRISRDPLHQFVGMASSEEFGGAFRYIDFVSGS